MTPTEERVARIMADPSRALNFDEIQAYTAMAQDAQIDGIDVDEFVADLEQEFGAIVRSIPWLDYSDQRASFRGCGVAMVPFWLLNRILWRPKGDAILPPPDPSRVPRLTVRHIALVIDQATGAIPINRMPTDHRHNGRCSSSRLRIVVAATPA